MSSVGEPARAFYALAQRPNGVTTTEARALRPDLFHADNTSSVAEHMRASGRVRRESVDGGFVHGGKLRFRFYADPDVTYAERIEQIESARMSRRLEAPRAARKAAMLKLAATSGVTNKELQAAIGCGHETAGSLLKHATEDGLLFRGGKSYPHRWFTDKAIAAAYVAPPRVIPRDMNQMAPKRRSQRLDVNAEAICRVKPTICPAGLDHRFTVSELPAGYVSALDPRECRGWARVVAG